jgi:uncharacterized protein YbaP (TraB family)
LSVTALRSALALCLSLAYLLGGLAHAKPQPPTYAPLAGKKALAVVPGSVGRHGIAHNQPNDLAASTQALTNCQLAWSTPCEIAWLNQEAVTSGERIRAQAGRSAHPLFLWRYRSATATVYLAGSIHLLKPSLYPLPTQLLESFAAADYLVLEVDAESANPALMQQLTTRYGILPGTTTLADVLPTPMYQRLSARLANYGTNIGQLARLKPALVMTELVRLRLAALGYLPEHGVEQYFRSQITHQKILELESVELQMRLLFDQPLSTQVQLMADTLDQELSIEPLLADLIVAWLAGNDQGFLTLFQQQSGDSDQAKAFTRQLLDDRNIGMANKIQSYLADRGSYFVLAGAAHFVGQNGIVELLKRRNIRGARIRSDTNLTPAVDLGANHPDSSTRPSKAAAF